MFTIRSKKAQLLRPLFASTVLSGVVLAGLIVVRLADDSAPPDILYIPIVVFLIGPIRMFNWWFSAGRTQVSVIGHEVVLRGRLRTVRIPSDEIADSRIVPGEWRPEWSRWAVHPQIVIKLRGGKEISRRVLLDSESVLRKGPELHKAIIDSATGHDVGGRPRI